jgi:pantetheine-phosphate adenylyltransferase
MKCCVYGGSFDPVTKGHTQVIENAAKLFDEVLVVVAPNYDKPTAMFTPSERVNMIMDSIRGMPYANQVKVSILPEQVYLADFAQQYNAVALVRGMRDTIDFNAEQKLCDTNRKIAPKLETVYLMPTANLSVVSSSWAKSLVGFKGWKKTLDGCVHPSVIYRMEEVWLKKKVKSILDEAHSRHIIGLFDFDSIWDKLLSSYKWKPYHNLSHIADMLTNFNVMVLDSVMFKAFNGNTLPSYKDRILMQMAIVFHDYKESEEASAEDPINTKLIAFIKQEDGQTFINYVMATKHSLVRELNANEAIVADLDLFVLAGNPEEYAIYRNKIQDEYCGGDPSCKKQYTQAEYREGRIKFLKSMLDKKNIYHTAAFRKYYDYLAIANMNGELRLMEMWSHK